MAKAVISDIKPGFTGSIKANDFSNASVSSIDSNTKITDIEHTVGKIAETEFPIAKIVGPARVSSIMQVLPFRIKFTTIGLNSGYGPNNPAPIGIAIIGTNNYIL